MAPAKKKLFFRGALSFPVRLGAREPYLAPEDDGEGSRGNADRLVEYFKNNESALGGCYPLGASRCWHNGVHLHTAREGEPVLAMAGGTVVAVRLGKHYAIDTHPFGSHSFVLIRHQLSLIDKPEERRSWDTDAWNTRDVTFYSLYMHLDVRASRMGEVPWLASYAPFLGNGLDHQGEIWRVKKPDGRVKGKVNVYVEPKPKERKLARAPALQKTVPVGVLVEILDEKPVKATQSGKSVKYQRVKVLDEKSRCDGWIRTDGDRLEKTDACRVVKELQSGGVARLDCTVRAGECIGHVGPMAPEGPSAGKGPKLGFHFEVFSEKPVVAEPEKHGWVLCADDSDDDVVCDAKSLLESAKRSSSTFAGKAWEALEELFSWLGRRSYEQVLTDEFKVAARRIITRNTSFWAVDWDKMSKEEKNKGWLADLSFTPETLKAAQRYSWWKELAGKVEGILPSSTLVYHYHPLELIPYLAKRVPRPPVFFIERKESGKNVRYVVSKPEHLDTGIADTVRAYEHRFPDGVLAGPDETALAPRTTYPHAQGDFTRADGKKVFMGLLYGGTPKLYEALIGKPLPALLSAVRDCAANTGIPETFLRNVWASIWKSEGGLNAFNSYDNGHLSLGGLQQIVAPVYPSGEYESEGELGAALHAVKSSGAAGAAVFAKYFGRYGFDTGPTHSKGVGYAAARSTALDTAPRSAGGPVELETLSDLERARWFIWSYCAKIALKDPEFIRLFYTYGFSRLKIVREELSGKFGSETVPVGKLLKTQLAQALVLDAHINLPKLAKEDLWRKAAKNSGLLKDADIRWEMFGKDLEHKIIGNMVKIRRTSAMSDGPMRSAYIILCVKGLAYPGKNRSFDRATYDAWAAKHNGFLVKLGYPGGALQLLWEANPEKVKVGNKTVVKPYPDTTPIVPDAKLKTWVKVLAHTYDFLEHERPAG